jgi:hypothetical protein
MSKSGSCALWLGCLLMVGCAAEHGHEPQQPEYDGEVLSRQKPTGSDADKLQVHSADAIASLSLFDADTTLSELDDAERLALCSESVARAQRMLAEKPERACKLEAQLAEALDPERCAATLTSCVTALDDQQDEDTSAESALDEANCDVPRCAATVFDYRSCNEAVLAQAAAYYDAFTCGAATGEQAELPGACAGLMRKCPEAFER